MKSTQVAIWRISQVAVFLLGSWLSIGSSQRYGECVSTATDTMSSKDIIVQTCEGAGALFDPFAWWIFGIVFAAWVAITYAIESGAR